MAAQSEHPCAVPVFGIVGGVGSGKSTVAGLMAQEGLAVIDADRIGHELLAEPDVRDAIVSRWGTSVLDLAGQVDRKALGRLVFGDRAQLDVLNAIMRPRIGQRIGRRIDEIRRECEAPGIVLDAAILLEAGWDRFCDQMVFVRADSSQRAQRVRQERGWDQETWQARENAQNSLDRKRDRCCHVLDNSSSLAYLRRQVRNLLHEQLRRSEDS